MKQVICWFKGHKWSDWFLNNIGIDHYEFRYCKYCSKKQERRKL